jgi:hypothetical protein
LSGHSRRLASSSKARNRRISAVAAMAADYTEQRSSTWLTAYSVNNRFDGRTMAKKLAIDEDDHVQSDVL